MVAIIVPGNYGAVIAVALGAIPVLGFVHGIVTGKQRKAAHVPYPHSYATVEQCKENVRTIDSGPTSASLCSISFLSVHSPYLPQTQCSHMNCTHNPKPLADKFNCAQRAHANFLENAPQTMLFTLVAGLKYPELAAGLGALWVFFRALFLHGYVFSGKAQGKGRMRGSFFWLVQGALWGLSVFGVGRELLDF
ncbi:hypothetical protein PENANT_c001G04708 [Penicillium antarcticum]|uniref:Glutathione S-transferase n=1 Tax=Penicillium antarcticum TaxID=416450 RepID=A0A1V6QN58_9EURO|nr:hypothetical protein PENANT_c001G04708 [Penicillium antarcticum]